MQGTEASGHAQPEVSECRRVFAAHHLHHLLRQLERRLLELDALAWGIREQEAEVDVKHMAFNVNQDVLVVPVFDLQDVADQAVSTERIREVLHCLLVLFRPGFTELASKVVYDGSVGASSLLLDRGDGERVRNYLDEAAVRATSQDFVGLEPQRQFGFLEDLVALTDQLHGKRLLP